MREQEIKLAQVKRSCKTAKIVTRIMTIIMAIASIMCLIGSGIVAIAGDKVNEAIRQGQGTFDITNPELNGVINLRINVEAMIQAGRYSQACLTICLFGAVICLCGAIIFGIITRTFVKLEKCETPFAPEIMKSIKAAFIALTVTVALLEGLGNAVVIGLCFWSVYTIMDYGCALQEEVDDTI